MVRPVGSYFGYDALGSVRRVFDSNGESDGNAIYDPFGVPIDDDIASSLGFAGEQTDDSGLVYLRARYMNPKTGSFLTTDPVRGVMGKSMSWNPYPYALGNPVNYTDPSGRNPLILALMISAGVGAYNAGRNLLKQVVGNLQNGRLPLECINGSDFMDSFIDGFILGAGVALVVQMISVGFIGLADTIIHRVLTSRIFAGIVGGALLLGAENLKNQIDKIIAEGRADNFIDALSELDPFSLVLDMVIGGVAGGVLAMGGAIGSATRAIGDAARVSTLIYIIGNVIAMGVWNVPFSSFKDIAINAIISGVLAGVDYSLVKYISGFSKVGQTVVYAGTGIIASASYHIATDDTKFESPWEILNVILGGAFNGFSAWNFKIPITNKKIDVTDAIAGVVNTISNALAWALDT